MSYIGSKPANKAIVASDLDPAVITGQTALAVAPADTDEFLISDGGVLKRLDASLIGGTNTPAFLAYNASNQTIANATWTKVVADTEVLDTDGKYTSNAFTPTVSGNYWIYASVLFDDGDTNNEIELQFYKNGSAVANPRMYQEIIPHKTAHDFTLRLSGIIVLDSDDYVELFVYHNVGADQVLVDDFTNFGGYKLIT
jgi:hypothetical protein